MGVRWAWGYISVVPKANSEFAPDYYTQVQGSGNFTWCGSVLCNVAIMTSSYGNILRVIGPLWGEFTFSPVTGEFTA